MSLSCTGSLTNGSLFPINIPHHGDVFGHLHILLNQHAVAGGPTQCTSLEGGCDWELTKEMPS